MEFVHDGYCGLFCGACPIMLGSKAGTESDQCFGCKSTKPAGHCITCGIKLCAQEKGYSFCYECSELGNCEKMIGFMADPKWPYHQAVLSNFDAIRQNGTNQWLVEQDIRWRCKKCNTPHSWWDEKCKECGEPVSSYKADL